MPNRETLVEMAGRLSEAALADIVSGNCTKNSNQCCCASGMAVKGEFAEHRLVDFIANKSGSALIGSNGYALREHLLSKDMQGEGGNA